MKEFTRGWDREQEFAERKHAFKTAWYLPWVTHLRSTLEPLGWTVEQLNFTVGVRGTVPEQEWEDRLQVYGIDSGMRELLLTELVDTALRGAVELLAAYQSHRTTRLAARGGGGQEGGGA